RELTDHGRKLDLEMGVAHYLTRAKARKYELEFIDGLAYQNPWWKSFQALRDMSPVRAESSRCRPDPPDMMGPDFGGFALSMSRRLYMAPHECTIWSQAGKGNFYHSSYTAGDTVLCTGTMLIRKGRILEIRNDSGHFRPTLNHLVNVLQFLKMHGVVLRGV